MGVTRWQWMGLGGGLATLLIVPSVAGAQRTASDAVPLQTPPAEVAEEVARPAAGAPLVEILDLERVLRGEGRGLTADEVAARALETAPSVEQGRAVLQQARSGASQAYLAFFPRLDFTGRYTRLSPITQGTLTGGSLSQDDIAALRALIGTVADPSAQALFNVNLESQLALANFSFPVLLDSFSFGAQLQYPVIDVFTQVLPSYEGAERMVDAQEEQIQASAAAVSQQAREAFYNYARARAATAVAESTVRTIEAQERVVQSAVDAGVTARVDLMRLRAQLAGGRVAVERARGGMATAAEALRALMHTDDAGELLVAEDLLGPLPAVEGSREDLIARAYEERPEARALGHMLRARDRQIEAAEGSRYPHLVLNGQFAMENPNQRLFPVQQRFVENWSLSAVLTWSPNDLFVGEARADQARASRAETETQLAQLRDGIRIQVTQAYETYRASRLSLEAAQAGIDAAAEGVRVRTEQIRAGAGLITELMAATADLARAQLDLISAAIDARIAYTQLQRATGADGPYRVRQ